MSIFPEFIRSTFLRATAQAKQATKSGMGDFRRITGLGTAGSSESFERQMRSELSELNAKMAAFERAIELAEPARRFMESDGYKNMRAEAENNVRAAHEKFIAAGGADGPLYAGYVIGTRSAFDIPNRILADADQAAAEFEKLVAKRDELEKHLLVIDSARERLEKKGGS